MRVDRGIRRILITVALLTLPGMASAGGDDDGKCARDAVRVGTACVDRYENSVWQIPPSQKGLITKVKEGKATLRDLERGGATQVAPAGTCVATDYPTSFPESGNWTAPLYAVSIPGVLPSACLSWFQAVQACALSDKHLTTNGEWQRAAAGTVDPGGNDGLTNTKCNTFSTGFRKTGEAGATPGGADSCISNWGAQDMVGNLWEWTEQWVDTATRPCQFWQAILGTEYPDDISCFGGVGQTPPTFRNLPGAMIRGGTIDSPGTPAGVLAVVSATTAATTPSVGFRCAR